MKKVLIANRGEIAVRIIRACKELNLETVAVYSTADKTALHVKLADEAICIGGPRSQESYLNADAILTAAELTNADAIHPGFGFLSENATFSDRCKENNIKFIGPSGDVIRKMGDKATAKKLMKEAGVPVVPGSEGIITMEEGISLASEIGYPVLIKASSGGGGKGMRIVHEESQFKELYQAASLEAMQNFGDDALYLEKFITNPKHIEFQILADQYGNVIHLGERDCSVQRRNQKMIEEAPCAALSEELRTSMGESSVKAAQYVNYENAGTIEYVVVDDAYYFIEMNTRIQVEHPVTEMITGIDLIRQQLKIADGKRLAFRQEDVKFTGHAIEARINAEDPKLNFRPSPSTVTALHVPGGFGVRFDSSLYQGYTIPPYYDSMIGKLIVVAPTRKAAILKMRRTLEELIVDGVTDNTKLLYMILHNPEYVKGKFNTGFIEKYLDQLLTYR